MINLSMCYRNGLGTENEKAGKINTDVSAEGIRNYCFTPIGAETLTLHPIPLQVPHSRNYQTATSILYIWE